MSIIDLKYAIIFSDQAVHVDLLQYKIMNFDLCYCHVWLAFLAPTLSIPSKSLQCLWDPLQCILQPSRWLIIHCQWHEPHYAIYGISCHMRNSATLHNIIQTHHNVLWDWQYFVTYSIVQSECEEYFAEYCHLPHNIVMDRNDVLHPIMKPLLRYSNGQQLDHPCNPITLCRSVLNIILALVCSLSYWALVWPRVLLGLCLGHTMIKK